MTILMQRRSIFTVGADQPADEGAPPVVAAGNDAETSANDRQLPRCAFTGKDRQPGGRRPGPVSDGEGRQEPCVPKERLGARPERRRPGAGLKE